MSICPKFAQKLSKVSLYVQILVDHRFNYQLKILFPGDKTFFLLDSDFLLLRFTLALRKKICFNLHMS